VIYLSLYNKLPDTQLKDLTSSDLMKLGQLTFIDRTSSNILNQLSEIKKHVLTLVSPGAPVFADGLKIGAKTANNNVQTFKPSDFFDDTYADTYLLQILAVQCQAGASDTAVSILMIEDGNETVILSKPTNVTAAGPLTYQPQVPLYINENNYLTVTNTASVDMPTKVYVAIVARGGAQ
jgi:hypothetical protein